MLKCIQDVVNNNNLMDVSSARAIHESIVAQKQFDSFVRSIDSDAFQEVHQQVVDAVNRNATYTEFFPHTPEWYEKMLEEHKMIPDADREFTAEYLNAFNAFKIMGHSVEAGFVQLADENAHIYNIKKYTIRWS